jgi:hypothetical protein
MGKLQNGTFDIVELLATGAYQAVRKTKRKMKEKVRKKYEIDVKKFKNLPDNGLILEALEKEEHFAGMSPKKLKKIREKFYKSSKVSEEQNGKMRV